MHDLGDQTILVLKTYLALTSSKSLKLDLTLSKSSKLDLTLSKSLKLELELLQ